MFRLTKDNGLIMGEMVFNLLLKEWEYHPESENMNVHVMTSASTLGGYSAYRFQTDDLHFKRCAWVRQNRVTDGIDVVLGTDDTTYYDDKRGRVPTDDAKSIELFYYEYALAAKAVYEFLMYGITSVQSTHYGQK